MKIFYLVLLLPAMFIQSQSVSVGFINTDENSGSESVQAYNYLYENNNFTSESLTAESDFFSYDVIWYHRVNPREITGNEISLKNKLLSYVKEGGTLLLSMDAVQLINYMELEEEPVRDSSILVENTGFGRKLGMHAFRNHPVFEGMFGGAYTWNSPEDHVCRRNGFFGDYVPNGKTVAVDWAYITLEENDKLILEYNLGKGKILAVGAYMYFSEENMNRKNLEKFTENSLLYLAGILNSDNKQYWNYAPLKVKRVNFDLREIDYAESTEWPDNPASHTLTSRYGSDNNYNVSAQRILMVGKEKGGIEEIWTHPFMALRDYEAGIKFSYDDTIHWLSDQRPSLTVKPESFAREYKFRRAYLTEIITPHKDHPTGIVHYEYRGVYPAKLYIKFKSNLRLMWPYSHKVTGEINCGFNDILNAFVFRDITGDYNTVIGTNKKVTQHELGQFSNINITPDKMKGVETDTFISAGAISMDLKMNDNADIIISGSGQGLERTLYYYSTAASNPGEVYEETTKYYRDVFNNSTMITTPDTEFNTGYRWAVYGTDKFFVNTPGVGKSLMAGYSSTATGWDGNHEISGRPGYAWYFGRDGQWSGFALNAYGDFAKVKEMLGFFQNYQSLDGKILHELTSSGVVHYDASDATPLYIVLAGDYLKHSGDIDFIRDSWEYLEAAVNYCYSTDTDGDLLIENANVGHGWVEGGALYGSHTTFYLAGCWAEALYNMAYMADAVGFYADAEEYKKQADEVKRIINEKFWNESTGYYNYGVLSNGTYNTESTILPAVPIGFGLTDETNSKKSLQEYSKNAFTSNWGTRILSEDSELFNPRGYHYGSVWPLFTGWNALADYKYGNYVQGYSHIYNNLQVYDDWSIGYVEEVLNGAEYQHSGVCRHQCWSETMVLQPALDGLLGFHPDAVNDVVNFTPRFLPTWYFVKVLNMKVWDYRLNLAVVVEDEFTQYRFTSISPANLEYKFQPALPKGAIIDSITVNGEKVDFDVIETRQATEPKIKFFLNYSALVNIFYRGGITVLPKTYNPKPGESPEGLRIVDYYSDNGNCIVTVEGLSGSEESFEYYTAEAYNKLSEGTLTPKDGNVYEVSIKFDEKPGKYSIKQIVISK